MKAGDLVRFEEEDYPQYKYTLGLIVEERRVDQFVVHVAGREHPFFIHRVSMEIVNASR
tara:strand:+ start:445 stop:621 length:177 start_codon:yes stop_codon:yes gene_type:complete